MVSSLNAFPILSSLCFTRLMPYLYLLYRIWLRTYYICSHNYFLVLSIKSAFNGVYGIPADSPWLAVGVVAFVSTLGNCSSSIRSSFCFLHIYTKTYYALLALQIVVSEWVGGLAAVALTDTVQGGIMVCFTRMVYT